LTCLRPPSDPGTIAALTTLLDRLAAADYCFVSPTPNTHRLVAERRVEARAGDLRDIFGWGLPFRRDSLDESLFGLMADAGVLDDGPLVRSTIRVSTLDERLHLHSARSAEAQAVFLGPDSYRFVRFLDSVIGPMPDHAVVTDVGAGAGAGALTVAARWPGARVTGVDVNPKAAAFLQANAAHAGLPVRASLGDGLNGVDGAQDLIIANPPFIADPDKRTYRHGGGPLGADLALDWTASALGRLKPGGRFVLYTGSPVVEGRDLLLAELHSAARAAGARLDYAEIDPDIFGSLLRQAAYREVERIAAVGAVFSL
jgi:SAM-dependent methyltransferase